MSSPSDRKKARTSETKKIWKTGGPEDLFTIEQLTNNVINTETRPAVILSTFPDVLGDFEPQVVRNHINRLKKQFANDKGLSLKNSKCYYVISNIYKYFLNETIYLQTGVI